MFKERICPDVFKIAKVIHLYKGKDKLSADNYRPISLLPQLFKILEKLNKVKCNSYLNKYNIISHSQYGVRVNMSTYDV